MVRFAAMLTSASGHSRRFWYLRSMSGQGLISEMPDLQFAGEGIGLDMILAPKREFESCAMNSATLNLLMSPRPRLVILSALPVHA